MTPIGALGWVSGGLVMLSGLPAVLANLGASRPPRPSMARDALQFAGNLGWVAYGVLAGVTPVAAMCALNAVFMTVLITQQLRSAAGARRAASLPPAKGKKHEEA